MSDPVNKPSHYQLFPDGTQAIDVIKAVLTPEEFRGYAKGNCLKYRLRAGKKDGTQQDIDKAETYVRMLEESPPTAMDRQTGQSRHHIEELMRNHHRRKDELRKAYCGPCSDCSKCPAPCD